MTVATGSLKFVADDAAIAGVDEAGRGPLAGPVVAAAVVLDHRRPIDGLRDSKQLTADERTRLAREIRVNARAFAIAFATPEEIDDVNILRATLLAMERAVLRLRVVPELVRIDGNQLPAFHGHRRRYLLETVVGGDDTVPAISAASILAKVCRDRLMRRWHRRFPLYGFDRHKGYATPQHLEALALHGPCPIHRRSFAPCRSEPEKSEKSGSEPDFAAEKSGSEPDFAESGFAADSAADSAADFIPDFVADLADPGSGENGL